jgi:hypothetical protein
LLIRIRADSATGEIEHLTSRPDLSREVIQAVLAEVEVEHHDFADNLSLERMASMKTGGRGDSMPVTPQKGSRLRDPCGDADARQTARNARRNRRDTAR